MATPRRCCGLWERSGLLSGYQLATLVGALLLGADFHPALPLAVILAGAAMSCSRTSALAFALIDSGALDFLASVLGCFTLGSIDCSRAEHSANGGSDQRSLDGILHRFLLG